MHLSPATARLYLVGRLVYTVHRYFDMRSTATIEKTPVTIQISHTPFGRFEMTTILSHLGRVANNGNNSSLPSSLNKIPYF